MGEQEDKVIEELEKAIKELEKHWGKNFIKSYIPIKHCPFIGPQHLWVHPEVFSMSHLFETNPRKWPPQVVECLCRIAVLISDKTWVRRTIELVVFNSIQYDLGSRGLQLTLRDCEVVLSFAMCMMNPLLIYKEEKKATRSFGRPIDDSDPGHDSNGLEAGAGGKQDDTCRPNLEQRGVTAASGNAEPKGKGTQEIASATSSSFSRGGENNNRKRSAVNNELPQANSVSTNYHNSTRDNTSGRPNHNIVPPPSLPRYLPPPFPAHRLNMMIPGNWVTYRYRIFPPLPFPATAPPAQVPSKPPPGYRRDEIHSDAEREFFTRDDSTTAHGKHATNRRSDNNEDEDGEEDDENILKAKLAAVEAELKLARLRVEAARRAKRARLV